MSTWYTWRFPWVFVHFSRCWKDILFLFIWLFQHWQQYCIRSDSFLNILLRLLVNLFHHFPSILSDSVLCRKGKNNVYSAPAFPTVPDPLSESSMFMMIFPFVFNTRTEYLTCDPFYLTFVFLNFINKLEKREKWFSLQ